MRGLHRVLAAALRAGAEVSRVAEHLSQRNESVDLLRAAAGLEALDLTAAAVEVADDITHILVGDNDADLHDGFENDGIRLLAGLLERHGTGDLERKLRRVDLVIGAVVQRDLDVDDRVTGENTGEHGALNTGIDRGNVFLGDRAADEGVDKLVTLAGLVGLDMDLDVTVLTLTTALTGVLGILIDSLGDGLLVGDLRSADIRLDLVLTEQAVDNEK